MPVLLLLLAAFFFQAITLAAEPAPRASAEPGAELTVVTVDGELVARFDLTDEPSWCVLWNHSVTGFAVRDCFAYREGNMLLVSHHTPDFAAGLGHLPGRGRLETDTQGHYVIKDIDEPVPGNAYRLRVGSLRVNHRILHGGRVLSLSAHAAGARVIVSAGATTADHKPADDRPAERVHGGGRCP